MKYQEMIPDSLQNLNDSLSTSDADTLGQISFDISRAFTTDNIMMPVIGYIVVFMALLFLYIVFSSITKFMQARNEKRLLSKGEKKEAETKDIAVSGELNAAISMALYLHLNDSHDFENAILTIKKVQKAYSPWSSKIYGLREYPKN